MSVITIDPDMLFGSFVLTQLNFEVENVSDVTGNTEVIRLGHPRWKASFTSSNDLTLAQSSKWERVAMKIRGRLNHIAVWDPVRVLPEGTARGTMTLYQAANASDTSVVVSAGSGQAGTTLEVGDPLQIGDGVGTSQYVKVTERVVLDANGRGTVNFEPYLRKGFIVGTPINYTRPVFYGKVTVGAAPSWSYATNAKLSSGFNFDVVEQWA